VAVDVAVAATTTKTTTTKTMAAYASSLLPKPTRIILVALRAAASYPWKLHCAAVAAWRPGRRVSGPLLRSAATLAAAVVLLWLFVDLDAYPLWILRAAVAGGGTRRPHETSVDRALTHNCASSPDYARPLAVVVPLIASQAARLENSLARWATPAGWPCRQQTLSPPYNRAAAATAQTEAPRPHLLFYFDRPLDHPETGAAVHVIRRVIAEPQLAATLATCFANVSFTTAALSAEESRNSYHFDILRNLASTRGSNAQFWAAFRVHAPYRHMFYMEPDTWPLRPNWLHRVDALTRDPVLWMRGTLMRYRPRFILAPEPFRSIYTRHINGNAIYELHDPCFAHYRDLVRQDHDPAAFDVALALYRMRRGRYDLDHAIAHRFGITDVVIDLGVESYATEDDLRQKFPGTFLAHAKAEFLARRE
jgi:hypothetical protein